MVQLPSGTQFEIASEGQRAFVTQVGAGLRKYTVRGRDVIGGFEADEVCPAGRGQVLLPWPNRIEGGSYEFEGAHHQLAIDELPAGNAIHGLVRWQSWDATDVRTDSVKLRHTLYPQPGFPFLLDLAVQYRLDAGGLTTTVTATNIGTQPCPFGAGFHPYFTLGAPEINGASLRVPAQTVLQSDERGIPSATMRVAGTQYDFRVPRMIGSTRLDHAFTTFERDDDGIAQIELRDGGSAIEVWMDGHFDYAMVFSGDALTGVDRSSLAVEPMTCAPNAFRTGESLVVLEQGRQFTAQWGITTTGF
jgi:aldose 1-epimerase